MSWAEALFIAVFLLLCVFCGVTLGMLAGATYIPPKRHSSREHLARLRYLAILEGRNKW